MRYLITGIVLLAGLLGAGSALAETLVRTGNQFELPRDQRIDGNFLGVGNPISIAGEVTGDATVLGNRITLTGIVGDDVLGIGVLTRLDGDVQGDVRIVSGNTSLSGTVKGDLLFLGGSLDVLSDAVIEGDLVIYAGTVIASGFIGGDIIGTAQNLTIDGPVGGAVDVHVKQLSLGSNASITESVRYASNNLLNQSLDTVIAGAILRNDPRYTTRGFSLGSALYPVLILLFATFVWFLLSRVTLARLINQTVAVMPRSAITGVISFFVFPLITFVLFVSLLGGYLWISDMTGNNSMFAFAIAILPVLVVLFGYITLFVLAIIALPAFFGKICMFASKSRGGATSMMSIMIGGLVCVILLLLPVIGPFVFFFSAVILLGGLLESLIRISR